MKVFYDTEFLEDGKTIELISIGMVTEEGYEYYAVNRDAPWRRIKKHEWLMANVVPGLPHGHGDQRNHLPNSWVINFHDPVVKGRSQIAYDLTRFLLGNELLGLPDLPDLWAWYGAYDHVVLAQLWGSMVNLPRGMPMWTRDLNEEILRHPEIPVPEQAAGLHNALADARHIKAVYELLTDGES
jgi:hypothetical protein